MTKVNPLHKLPIRDDVKVVTYHRAPTKSEIKFGAGATHYREFNVIDACHKDSRVLKSWFVADDGLRYYR